VNPDKTSLRRKLRNRLSQLPRDTMDRASAALCLRLQHWSPFRAAQFIALFYPTLSEPGLLPLLNTPDKTFLFPLCHRDRSLTWHAPVRISEWKPSPYGIIEPDPALSPALPASSIDLVLVPGLAFTEAGDRLGHGAGYYDRFLNSLPGRIPTAGICFSAQLEPWLPAESHDVRVQHLFHA
jgi:5-formyltetrahydrofolate cyclo-ligase